MVMLLWIYSSFDFFEESISKSVEADRFRVRILLLLNVSRISSDLIETNGKDDAIDGNRYTISLVTSRSSNLVLVTEVTPGIGGRTSFLQSLLLIWMVSLKRSTL